MEQALDQEGAAVQLEQALSLRLEELMAANQGEVIQSDFVTQEKDGCFSVILLAECREEIGREQETGPDPRVQQEENDNQ